PVAHPREVKIRLLDGLFAGVPRLVPRRLLDDAGPLDDVVDRLVTATRRRLRQILTEHFLTLELPDGRVRLGTDVLGVCPPHLLRPLDAELREVLARIDPEPGITLGSGVRDWGDLGQRMHFITELFRTRQEDAALLDPPPDV